MQHTIAKWIGGIASEFARVRIAFIAGGSMAGDMKLILLAIVRSRNEPRPIRPILVQLAVIRSAPSIEVTVDSYSYRPRRPAAERRSGSVRHNGCTHRHCARIESLLGRHN